MTTSPRHALRRSLSAALVLVCLASLAGCGSGSWSTSDGMRGVNLSARADRVDELRSRVVTQEIAPVSGGIVRIGNLAGSIRLTQADVPRVMVEATVYAKEKGKDGQFHHLAAAAYWESGADLNDLSILKGFVEGVGLDWGDLGPRIESGEYRETVLREYEAAKEKGVSGTPTYMIGGEIQGGDVSIDDGRDIRGTGTEDDVPGHPVVSGVSRVTYNGFGYGIFAKTGRGRLLTKNDAVDSRAAAVWDEGKLRSATAGRLVSVLDINWLVETNYTMRPT